MAHIFCIANQKGGVGKTTTTVNLAAGLAKLGQRVLLVDLDPQGNATMGSGIDKRNVALSVYDVLLESASITEAAVLADKCGYHVLSANRELAGAEVELVQLEHRDQRLKNALSAVDADYDFVLIDCPPVMGVLMVNAIAACDRILIPVQTEFLALKGLERMIATMALMRTSQQKDYAYTIIPTMYDKRTKASLEAYKELKAKYQDKVWSAVVPVDTKFRDASLAQTPPSEYASASRGVFAYNTLLTYLLQLSAE